MKRILSILFPVLAFLLLLPGALLFFTALWVRRTWSSLSFSTIVFQLENSLKGTGAKMIPKYLLTAALPAVSLFAVILVLYIILLHRISSKKPAAQSSDTASKLQRQTVRKTQLLLTLSVFLAALLLAGISVLLLWKRIGLGNYLKYGRKNSVYIEENYVNPAAAGITFPEKKRNLIYIYLESMELTSADTENGGVMAENHIPNLTRIAKESECFSGAATSKGASSKSEDSGTDSSAPLNGAVSLYGTDWTMGGMFAETAGLPLLIPIQKNSMFTQNEFFPSVTTLGDILEENGYQNILLIGSDAEFGGRDLYYRSHGNYEIHDYKYAKKNGRIPEDYMVFWGYEDEKLFQFAKEELSDLSGSDGPFNLTLLTVDTHFEDGYRCRLCDDHFADSYENAIACSDRQVAAFVEWCREQDFYENTTIIISGDHPTMDKDYNNMVPADYERKVFVSMINPAPAIAMNSISTSRRAYSTFDLFPTTLSALGADIPGHRLGLGTDLYSGVPTLLERDSFDEMDIQLQMHSAFMDRLANIEASSDEAFLAEIDSLLAQTKVTLSLTETGQKGYYTVKADLLTDRPSIMNYIARIYVTASDGTYSKDILLEKDDAASLSEGKTVFSALVPLPLSEDYQLEQYHESALPNHDEDHSLFREEETTEGTVFTPPASWQGTVTVTLTIDAHSEKSISDWSESFPVTY